MAVAATGSKYTCKTNYLIAAACAAMALWFLYDGWLNEEFQNDENISDLDLQMNRIWIPAGCGLVIIYCMAAAWRLKSKKIVAAEKGLALSTGQIVPYKSVRQIDKRYFEKEGHFTIEYEEQGGKKQLKLTDRTWDGLGLLLDELVKQTGAVPVESLEQKTKPQDKQAPSPDKPPEETGDPETDN
jgi:hypothetical protein